MIPRRYFLVAGTFLISLLLYIDRTCIQVAGEILMWKLGRSSRLGERSRGVLDAGSCSCYMILETFADQIIVHIEI